MSHEHVVAGLATALQAGALTADAVALQARKFAETDDHPHPTDRRVRPVSNVVSLTERRLAQLPADNRPLPTVTAYDQLLTGPNNAATAGPVIGDYDGVRDAVKQGFEQLLSGKSPKAALKATKQAADTAIADYNERIGA